MNGRKWIWILSFLILTVIGIKIGKDLRGYYSIGGECLIPELIYILFIFKKCIGYELKKMDKGDNL